MNQPTFLALDLELGGSTEDCSILTAHFAVCDKDWNVLNELDLKLRPNDKQYTVTAQGMSINKIDLHAHDKEAISYSEGGRKIRDFLWANTGAGSLKLIPVGKGIKGDIDRLTSSLLNANTFHQFVSYRNYDITPIIIFLKRTGKLDSSLQESLQALGDYFDVKAEWHTARGDNIAGIEIMKLLESL